MQVPRHCFCSHLLLATVPGCAGGAAGVRRLRGSPGLSWGGGRGAPLLLFALGVGAEAVQVQPRWFCSYSLLVMKACRFSTFASVRSCCWCPFRLGWPASQSRGVAVSTGDTARGQAASPGERIQARRMARGPSRHRSGAGAGRAATVGANRADGGLTPDSGAGGMGAATVDANRADS